MTCPKELQTVIFWGAGATRALGIRTTHEQGRFIRQLAGTDTPVKSLQERVGEALADSCIEPWRAALIDLICILGDTERSSESIHFIDNRQFDAMRRNSEKNTGDDEIRRRIIDLRLTYDWPALKSAVRICPGSTTDAFKLNDLFNILDMHIPSGFGFRGAVGSSHNPSHAAASHQFFDARRLIGAKNALLMLLIALFYVDYQVCTKSKGQVLKRYSDFATLLGRRMQRKGINLAHAGQRFDLRDFYQGDVGFVSMNYDPILFWVQFVANRELNRSRSVPHIGAPPVPLYLYHDFGHVIPSRRIGRYETDLPWYPMNEAVAQRLNESEAVDHRVRLTKMLFPHGCLCWRECPDCGKLSAYLADSWELAPADLFPPPPLLAFSTNPSLDRISDGEKKQRESGRIDARACLHCGTLNFANHTQVVMQSSFKARPPSFIEEIQRDLQATTMQAGHVILMGYSLPPDDVTYRAFFSARSQPKGVVKCTVVNLDPSNPGWYGPTELASRAFKAESPVNSAREVFGIENVRFYGGGIPEVFLDGGVATDAKLDNLLVWSS